MTVQLDFDEILLHLGSFGRYQKRIYFLICLPSIFCSMQVMVSVFITHTPEFSCVNGTDNSARRINKPVISSQNYSVNRVLKEGCFIPGQSNDNGTSLTELCQVFKYTNKDFSSTIVTQFDLVCDRAYLSTLSTGMFMAGILIGSFLLGILSDIIGRKKVLIVSVLGETVMGISAGFCQDIVTFIIVRFFVGVFAMAIFMTSFVIGLELIGPNYRILAGIAIEYFFAFGYLLVTWISYTFRNWRAIQISISVPFLIFLSYHWFIPESARWLLAKGKDAEAEGIIRTAAKVNQVEIPEELFRRIEGSVRQEQSIISIRHTRRLIIRTAVISFNWLVVAMGYYGLSLYSANLNGDLFVNFLLSGLVEFPAYTLCFFCIKFGRKGPYICSMLVGGLACIAVVLAHNFLDVEGPVIENYYKCLTMLGKLCITTSFAIIYFWSAELYPTVLRNSLLGVSSTMARLGTVFAPFIADMGKFLPNSKDHGLPSMVFGIAMIFGGLTAASLPETSGRRIPETVEEADIFPDRIPPKQQWELQGGIETEESPAMIRH